MIQLFNDVFIKVKPLIIRSQHLPCMCYSESVHLFPKIEMIFTLTDNELNSYTVCVLLLFLIQNECVIRGLFVTSSLHRDVLADDLQSRQSMSVLLLWCHSSETEGYKLHCLYIGSSFTPIHGAHPP